jgi:hypothetical protein
VTFILWICELKFCAVSKNNFTIALTFNYSIFRNEIHQDEDFADIFQIIISLKRPTVKIALVNLIIISFSFFCKTDKFSKFLKFDLTIFGSFFQMQSELFASSITKTKV